jgi:hypothetical protein
MNDLVEIEITRSYHKTATIVVPRDGRSKSIVLQSQSWI